MDSVVPGPHQPGGRTGDQDVLTQRLSSSSIISVSSVLFFTHLHGSLGLQQVLSKDSEGNGIRNFMNNYKLSCCVFFSLFFWNWLILFSLFLVLFPVFNSWVSRLLCLIFSPKSFSPVFLCISAEIVLASFLYLRECCPCFHLH